MEKKLLLVDDEENILNGMYRFISANTSVFTKIYCADNGQAALDMIYAKHPDVMLLDVQMSVKSGLEVMKEAQAAGVCPKTIILSGYDSFSYVQQALRLGALDYLLKPCRSTEILAKLEAVAGEEKAAEKEEGQASNPILETAKEYISEHLAEEVSLPAVAAKTGVTAAYLSSLFSKKLGISFTDYLNKVRIDCACDYMNDAAMKVYEIAFKVGFHDEKYFSKVFRKVTGMSPSEYRKKKG